VNGGGHAQPVGHESREERAHGVAEVTPESVHAVARGLQGGVRDIFDDREQRGIDHGRPEPLEHGAQQPDRIGARTATQIPPAWTNIPPAMRPLRPIQSLNSPLDNLERAPDPWVRGLDDSDRRDAEARSSRSRADRSPRTCRRSGS